MKKAKIVRSKEVLTIFSMKSLGRKNIEISKQLKITPSTVSRILNNKTKTLSDKNILKVSKSYKQMKQLKGKGNKAAFKVIELTNGFLSKKKNYTEIKKAVNRIRKKGNLAAQIVAQKMLLDKRIKKGSKKYKSLLREIYESIVHGNISIGVS